MVIHPALVERMEIVVINCSHKIYSEELTL